MNVKKLINNIVRKFGYQFVGLSQLGALKSTERDFQKYQSLCLDKEAHIDELKAELLEIGKLTHSPKQKEHVVYKESVVVANVDKFDSRERFKNLKNIGFVPNSIMDCGAFIGKWAKEIHEIYPDADLLLIEPNVTLNDQIAENISEFSSKVELHNVAVSEVKGQAILNVWLNSQHSNETTALAASSLMGHVQGDASSKLNVQTDTIDSIVENSKITPDLLKLDLQGAELPALRGAVSLLETVEVCVIEFGCLDAYIDRTTPIELCEFMRDYDYVLYDIWDLRYRPYDSALAGGDFVFVKADSRLREHKDYF